MRSTKNPPKTAVQSQFSLKQMAVFTTFAAASLACLQALGLPPSDAAVGVIGVTATCVMTTLVIEARRQNRIDSGLPQ